MESQQRKNDRPMTDHNGTTAIRSMKLLHYLLTVFLFAAACRLFYFRVFRENPLRLRCGTALFVYCVILLFSMRTYSAYNVGAARIRVLIFSQTLADLVSACVLYVFLLINQRELVNPLPMAVSLGAQAALNCIWSYSVTGLYFRLRRAKKTVLIYRSEGDLRCLEEVKEYPRQFQVTKEIKDPPGDIHEIIGELRGAEAVFVSGVDAALRRGIARYCVEHDICCYVIPHVDDMLLMGARYTDLFRVPAFCIMRAAPNMEEAIAKRAMDIVLSAAAIVVLSPFMLLTALAIKLYDGGPVLYKQVRLTKNGRKFQILKFRSMCVNAEQDGVARLAAENDTRITPVGKVIRACRLDELPQLFNILKGDMSIVGPRPERPEIAEQYEALMPAFSLRLQVKAGLTGLAQVYGRYNTDPRDKLKMDLMYMNQMSMMQDIRLIFATIKVLFMKESTSGVAAGQITAAGRGEEKEYALK